VGRTAIDLGVLESLTIGLGAVTVLVVLLVGWLLLRTGRLGRRLDALTRGAAGDSLESTLSRHLDRVDEVVRAIDQLEARAAVMEGLQRRSFQRVGLVRYNPFEDTGGNQSFAIALLDQVGDGFVLSSLHARTGTRVYAKAVTGGRAEAQVSAEEQEALRLAMGSFTEARRAS
jgi:hypothetical protein